MDLVKILYQPYVIIIFLSLLITLITFFICRNNNKIDEKNNESTNLSKILLYTFIISFLILMGLNYLLKYMNDNKFFQKGGIIKNITDNLTIVADDVDYGILED
jgi:hypothetical protein